MDFIANTVYMKYNHEQFIFLKTILISKKMFGIWSIHASLGKISGIPSQAMWLSSNVAITQPVHMKAYKELQEMCLGRCVWCYF